MHFYISELDAHKLSGRCDCSIAVVTTARYERDIRKVRCILKILKT